jgi:SAM-dependent methyltransferase
METQARRTIVGQFLKTRRLKAALTQQDASSSAEEQAAAVGVEGRISFDQHDLSATFPEGEFDLVSAQFLHSPVELPRGEILRRAAGAVAPGGSLLVVGHAEPPPWARHHHDADGHHMHFPTTDDVIADLALGEAQWVREARDGGVEDWFYFAARPERQELVYELDVSQFHALRLVNRVLEFLDADGTPRLRMAAPWLLDRGGAVHQLSVEVKDCDVDRDPRGPWGRELVPLNRDQCHVELSWSLPESAYPLWVDPYWSPTNLMISPRALHSATRLADGRVLLAGGTSDVLPEIASCELFDPATGTFSVTSPLSESKRTHSAIGLEDGRVLVVAGNAGAKAHARAVAAIVVFRKPLDGMLACRQHVAQCYLYPLVRVWFHIHSSKVQRIHDLAIDHE